MKITNYIKTSFIDYPGLISCVIFTKGCNMSCEYCHNKEFMNLDNLIDEEEIFKFLKKRKEHLDAVVISGGEPTLQNDIVSFCKKIKEYQLKIKLDTNGSNPSIIKELMTDKLIDYIAMDIKTSPVNYSKICGLNFSKVKESIELIKHYNGEFRTTMFPGVTEQDIEDIKDIIYPMQLIIQQYRPTKYCDIKPYEDLYIKNLCERHGMKLRGI